MTEENDIFFEKKRLLVDAGQSPVRIDKYLTDHLPDVSRNRIQNAIAAGGVFVGENIIKSSYKVKPNDVIRLILNYEPRDYTITPEDIPLEIVYEDDQVLVVNKRAGMVVHPGHGNYSGTLLHALAFHFQNALDVNDPAIGLVHRIDKDTSGLLLVAKTPIAKTRLGKQFFEHSIDRCYHALVWGRMEQEDGTIHVPLIRSAHDRTRYTIADLNTQPTAKDAITHWKIIERFRYVTLLECRLETGRTHQIRVHMQHCGHPLFNDPKYGGTQILKGLRTQQYKLFVEKCFALCPRQLLHAKTLGFTHPTTNERMCFEAPTPNDMQDVLNAWREYTHDA